MGRFPILAGFWLAAPMITERLVMGVTGRLGPFGTG